MLRYLSLNSTLSGARPSSRDFITPPQGHNIRRRQKTNTTMIYDMCIYASRILNMWSTTQINNKSHTNLITMADWIQSLIYSKGQFQSLIQSLIPVIDSSLIVWGHTHSFPFTWCVRKCRSWIDTSRRTRCFRRPCGSCKPCPCGSYAQAAYIWSLASAISG